MIVGRWKHILNSFLRLSTFSDNNKNISKKYPCCFGNMQNNSIDVNIANVVVVATVVGSTIILKFELVSFDLFRARFSMISQDLFYVATGI